MRGVRRQLELEAIKKENKVRSKSAVAFITFEASPYFYPMVYIFMIALFGFLLKKMLGKKS